METNPLHGNATVPETVLEEEFLITLNKKCFTFFQTIAIFHLRHIIVIHTMQAILHALQLPK
jgi:hypothetical protein